MEKIILLKQSIVQIVLRNVLVKKETCFSFIVPVLTFKANTIEYYLEKGWRFDVKIEPTVRNETIRIAKGTCLFTLIMLLIFALLKKFSLSVVLGAALGTATAILNFFLLGLSVQKAAARMKGVEFPPEPDPDDDDAPPAPTPPEVTQAKQQMQMSYTGRMVMLAAVGILGLTLPCFHAVATVIPFLFPRLIIQLWSIQQNKHQEV